MSQEETKTLDQEINKLEVHPLIQAQEKSNETTVEFSGFVGSSSGDVVRLYSDLGISAYIEIPKDAIVHLEKDPNDVKGKVRIFISANKEVTEVIKRRVTANESSFSLTSNQIGPLLSSLSHTLTPRQPLGPLANPIKECADKCESRFARAAIEVIRLRNVALGLAMRFGYDSSAYLLALARAEQAETQAVGLLFDCLRSCPFPLFYDINKIAEGFIAKYLPQG